MPARTLPTSTDPRVTAWQAVVSVIKRHPEVSKHGILWRVPTDTDFDNDPPMNRITVKFSPLFLPMVEFCMGGWGRVDYEAPIQMDVEIFVLGSLAANSQNIWSAIQTAVRGSDLRPQERVAHDQSLLASGVHDTVDFTPATTALDNTNATGSFTIITHVKG